MSIFVAFVLGFLLAIYGLDAFYRTHYEVRLKKLLLEMKRIEQAQRKAERTHQSFN